MSVTTTAAPHQYLRRECGSAVDERLFGDRIVRFLYSSARERAPALFRALTGRRISHLLGVMNFDLPLTAGLLGNRRFLERAGVDLSECLNPPEAFRTPRQIFERKIRYWERRPMDESPQAVVSPADSRAVIGSFDEQSGLFVKGKFFEFAEFLGSGKCHWHEKFCGGDFAIFRLTPDKYHFNHTPVAGRVDDIYEIAGACHSCNPSAVVELATPYSKNRRVVTVIDTDVPGGSGVGFVAMVEIVALMIGQIVQCYSDDKYDDPRPVAPGMFVRKGQPKSLYRPGSSTDVLIFERGRVEFEPDLIANRHAAHAASRFTAGFGFPLVETEVAARSSIGRRRRSREC